MQSRAKTELTRVDSRIIAASIYARGVPSQMQYSFIARVESIEADFTAFVEQWVTSSESEHRCRSRPECRQCWVRASVGYDGLVVLVCV